MRLSKSLWIIAISFPLALSCKSFAQDSRFIKIHLVTHISGGWVALSNGELYKCRFTKTGTQGDPACILAAGLPSEMQSVSTLWAEDDEAWVAYTDGQVYGCRYRHQTQNESPVCTPATGLP